MKRADILASLDIGSCVKKLREKKGLSQEELARGICDRTNITKLENGHSKIPSLSFILLICDRLEITIEEFLNFSLSNSYSLDRKFILDCLMNEKTELLEEYIKSINSDFLSKKDKKYYTFLIGKIALFNHNNILARQIFLSLTNNVTKDIEDFIDFFSYHELNKYQLHRIPEKIKNYLYDEKTIEELTKKKTDNEYIFFINDLLLFSIVNGKNDCMYFLSKELQFINSHEIYKYLINYYKNKILICKDNEKISRESSNKISAIERKANN